MNLREWLLLGVLSILWGGSFFFIKVVVRDLPTLTVVCGRVGLTAIALTSFVALTGQKMPTSLKIWSSFLVMGVLNNLLPFGLLVWGETQIDSSLARFLTPLPPFSQFCSLTF